MAETDFKTLTVCREPSAFWRPLDGMALSDTEKNLAEYRALLAEVKAERDAEMRAILVEAIAPLMGKGPEAIAAMLVEEFSFDG